MSGPKHPGPWFFGITGKPEAGPVPFDYSPSGWSDAPTIFDANGEALVGCDEYDVFNSTDALRLMLAAPELLEALREVVRVFERNPSSIVDTVWVTGDRPETLYDHCRAAIAKATGEEA